jgi:ABC-2 type transport system ATP-binding protein
MNVLSVRNLKKSFKRDIMSPRVAVLKGVDFSLPAGSITGFLGANGAGKTTTLKCILGLLQSDEADVTFFNGQPLNSSTKSRIGFLPERSYFYEYLTAFEFLSFYAELSGKIRRSEISAKVSQILARVRLEAHAHKRLRTFSKGMLQKAGIAQALIHNPELVILDEPMSGLDPDGRYAVAEIIHEVAAQGAAVFFSSHLLNDAERICDRVVMLKDGRTLFEGALESLLNETKKGFRMKLAIKNDFKIVDLPDERALQVGLANALAAGESLVDIHPIRMSLEEIFVKRALHEGGA